MISLFNLLLHLLNLLLIEFIKLKKQVRTDKSLLIIRLDSIGDYILFRNFLELLRNHEKYRNYKITLCGNVIWKDIAINYDNKFLDEFVWIDRFKFRSNIFYKYKILKNLYQKGFEIVIETIFTRELLYGDLLVKACHSKVSIGSLPSPNKDFKTRVFTNSFYSKLINTVNENLFEFERNKRFFSSLLDLKINIKKPYFNWERSIYDGTKNYMVIFPGAKDDFRRWSKDNFAGIVNYLIDNYNYKIIICGSKSEIPIAKYISNKVNSSRVLNLTGGITVNKLIEIIGNAELLISNETVAPHIAVAVNCEFICISNGNHFGRFHPYPSNIFDKGHYVYPEEIMKNIDKIEFLKFKYRYGSSLNINSIKLEKVIKIIDETLKKQII
jgi:ADP-heptose:LPS heptosyltransferase